jgi:hypothetical protein
MMREKGRVVADALSSDDRCFQVEAAHRAGLTEKTYYEWLAGEDECHEAFRSEVLPAVWAQARRAEEKAEQDIFAGEQPSSAAVSWHKFKLERRYRKLFGDLAQKHEVEVSGKGGGPIQVEAVVILPDDGSEPKG